LKSSMILMIMKDMIFIKWVKPCKRSTLWVLHTRRKMLNIEMEGDASLRTGLPFTGRRSTIVVTN